MRERIQGTLRRGVLELMIAECTSFFFLLFCFYSYLQYDVMLVKCKFRLLSRNCANISNWYFCTDESGLCVLICCVLICCVVCDTILFLCATIIEMKSYCTTVSSIIISYCFLPAPCCCYYWLVHLLVGFCSSKTSVTLFMSRSDTRIDTND
jgi:hypothetical protein